MNNVNPYWYSLLVFPIGYYPPPNVILDRYKKQTEKSQIRENQKTRTRLVFHHIFVANNENDPTINTHILV